MLSSQTQERTVVSFYSSRNIDPVVRSFSWKQEARELFSFKIFNILWWPLFRLRQHYFTHSVFFKHCKKLPGFKNLWNTIQKGSFAYNCLFLGMKPYQRSFSSTDLVDVTTLALFFGDEFIDGVCKEAGKPVMRELLNANPEGFYLKKKLRGGQVKLVYAFNINKLLPRSVMDQVTPKYGISYAKFYGLLEQFLNIMNAYLIKLPFAKAEETANKIMDVCNTCLESYLHDINSDPVEGQIRDVASVLHFHEMKTRYMQEKFLELRCILADREHMMNSKQTQGWLDIMRVVQIYDDLQDVVEDDGYQDNLVISVAFHKYREEWEWLKKERSQLQSAGQRHFLLSVFMPQTIDYCLKIASNRMKSMNWEQQKIMHYLLFKNWFVGQAGESSEDFLNHKAEGEELLSKIYKQLEFLMPAADSRQIRAHLVNSCFHSQTLKKFLRKKLGWTVYYQLRYDLLVVPTEMKAKAFDKLSCIKED